MANNINLKGLFFNDLSKLHDFGPVMTAPKLEELHISGGLWKNANLESLYPIGEMLKLKYLSLMYVDIADNSLAPLYNLTSLRELRLTEETYETEMYAELAARLPNTKCKCFQGYVVDELGGERSIRIVGKRKPNLDPIKNSERIKRYTQEFEQLIQAYKDKL
jgi:hypothetical protein